MRYFIISVQVPDLFSGTNVNHDVYWDDSFNTIRVFTTDENGLENEMGSGNPVEDFISSGMIFRVSQSNGTMIEFIEYPYFPYVEIYEANAEPIPPLTISIVATPDNNGLSTGTATITGGGGIMPYTYSIDGINFTASNVFTGLAAGTYKGWVKGANGETATAIFSILAVHTYSSTKQYIATCPANHTGQATGEATVISTVSQLDADARAMEAAIIDANSKLVCNITLGFAELENHLEDNGFTVSYIPELKSWTGHHDYKPTLMLSMGKRVFIAKRDVIEELNKGAAGTYFGITYDSTINVVFNQNQLITKVADNLFTQSTECFDKIEVNNTQQGSGLKDITLIDTFDYDMEIDVIAKKKNNQYQMNIPRTVDETRFKDKYHDLKLVVDNNKHTSFTVNYLTLLFRPSAR
jgi:hypothetical protein